jgi:serine/threonine protein kinase
MRDARTAAGRLTPNRRTNPGSVSGGVQVKGSAMPSLAEEESAPVEVTPQARKEPELKPGTQVGEYVVSDKIGEGGMGTIYAAVHPVIGKKVAIKLLNASLSEDPSIVQRFIQEARSVNQIGHRNIVDIFAFGQLDSGRHYYVMEFLEGRTLKKRLESEPALSYAEVFTILIDVLDALEAAHEKGIVHRDLKPDNIFLVEGKNVSVKLLDFGIAKLLRRGYETGNTRTGAPLGTPFYMAPEQCRSKAVDARTDLYAMGVIMFEVFTGRLPFPGPDYIDTVNGHLSSPPPLPNDYAKVPGEVEALILHCLEKDPDRRPQHSREIRDRLIDISTKLEVQLIPKSSGGLAVVTGKSGTQPSVPFRRVTPPPTKQRRTAWSILGVLALLTGLGLGAATMLRKQSVPSPTVRGEPLELEIGSEPPGANVLLDGRLQIARTPGHFAIERGDVAVRVEKEGFKPHDEMIKFADGERRRQLAVRLEPLPAALRAHTPAKDAVWLLDGKKAGDGERLEIAQLQPGSHVLRVEAKGMQAREETLQLKPAEKAELEWSLSPTGKKTHKGSSSALPDAPNLDFKAP